MQKVNSLGKWKIGDKIASRFEVQQIFLGGQGIVLVCYDSEHKITVALKTFKEEYLFSEEAKKLFIREATFWTELGRCSYIVNSFYVEMFENRLFIVLEYIPPDSRGRNTLTHHLGNLSLPDILKFSIQFCYGMEYAYSKGIDAHRDIKPDNIMITPDKTVKITDFGLAKAFQEIQSKEDIISSGESSGLSVFQTKQGKKVCGTLPYMAPEQFDGYADKRSDIYSFGITLYRMVMNGQLPFVGKGRTDEEIQQDYEKLHKYEKIELPAHPLSSVINICLRKEPAGRYQSFQEVKEELQKLLLEETGEQVALPEITKLSIGDLINRGIALDSLYRYEEAIAYYDKAIMNEPGNVQAWNNKGYSLVNLALAAQKDSGNWDSWNNTEWSSINLGRFEEAIVCYNEAIKINPQYEKAYANKGYVLVCLGKLKEAINCCDAAIKINPTHDWPWYLKGETLAKLHKLKEAIACFQQVLKINPRYCEAWLNMGCIAFGFKAYKEALVCTEKAIKLNPDFAQAHQLKQSILQELGK